MLTASGRLVDSPSNLSEGPADLGGAPPFATEMLRDGGLSETEGFRDFNLSSIFKEIELKHLALAWRERRNQHGLHD